MKYRRPTAEHSRKHQATSAFIATTAVFPKLTVNQPNDKFEQQADAMADRVMRMEQEEDKLRAKPIGEGIQRACAACEGEEMQRMSIMRAGEGDGMEAPPTLANDLSRSKGGGRALPDSTQARMNSAFGTDFSNVRVHTGGQANQMSQSIQAKAFTHGSDIYFNKGQYQPGSSGGDHLLAHELTHVVQQGGGSKNENIQRAPMGIKLPTGIRFLSKKEFNILFKVYGISLTYPRILITNGLGLGGTKFTTFAVLPGIGAVVVLNMGKAAYDSPASNPDLLIHEAAHAWQSEHHPVPTAFMGNSALSQGLAKARGESAYCYKPGKFFGFYAAEQIAQQVENGEPDIRAHVRMVPATVPDPANILSLSVPRTEKRGAKGVKC